MYPTNIDFEAAKKFFESNDIDLAICDHFSDACYSAADMLRIPYIVTSTLPITKGIRTLSIGMKQCFADPSD